MQLEFQKEIIKLIERGNIQEIINRGFQNSWKILVLKCSLSNAKKIFNSYPEISDWKFRNKREREQENIWASLKDLRRNQRGKMDFPTEEKKKSLDCLILNGNSKIQKTRELYFLMYLTKITVQIELNTKESPFQETKWNKRIIPHNNLSLSQTHTKVKGKVKYVLQAEKNDPT